MTLKDNPNTNLESLDDLNKNMIASAMNNTLSSPITPPKNLALDRVKPPTEKKRNRECER